MPSSRPSSDRKPPAFVRDLDAFRRELEALPTVAHALSSGQVLAITDAEIRQAFLACIDTITETPEPYEQAWQARDAQSDAFRVDPAVFQDVFGVDLVKALAAVQLPRRLENGDVLDVSRLSDEDLARLFNRKPE